jgi:acetyl/propionyl-CoA carboxylase alpha subunit
MAQAPPRYAASAIHTGQQFLAIACDFHNHVDEFAKIHHHNAGPEQAPARYMGQPTSAINVPASLVNPLAVPGQSLERWTFRHPD